MSPKLGPFLHGSNPIRTFKPGFKLVAFDECTQFLALYNAQVSKVLMLDFYHLNNMILGSYLTE